MIAITCILVAAKFNDKEERMGYLKLYLKDLFRPVFVEYMQLLEIQL